MARVTLTEYECAHDLLPALCAKCGRPAGHRVPRKVRSISEKGGGARGHLRDTALIVGLVVGLSLFPPLAVFVIYRWADVVWVKVPMCDAHRADWDWRDRAVYRVLLPGWVAAVLALYVGAAVVSAQGGEGGVLVAAGPVCLGVVLVLENGVIGYGAVRVSNVPPGNSVRLERVHPAFADALAEDRARGAVWDPNRRPAQADVQADYDDEPG